MSVEHVPTRYDVPVQIRGCICRECGRVAPSWFHTDFLMGSDGFTCVWCAFPEKVEKPALNANEEST